MTYSVRIPPSSLR